MPDEKITELILKISTELATLNQQTKQVLDTLSKHETRLTNLENHKWSVKDSLVKWLVIALISSLSVIVTLTGSTAVLSRLLGMGG